MNLVANMFSISSRSFHLHYKQALSSLCTPDSPLLTVDCFYFQQEHFLCSDRTRSRLYIGEIQHERDENYGRRQAVISVTVHSRNKMAHLVTALRFLFVCCCM